MHYHCLTIGNSVIDTFLTLSPDSPQLKVNKAEKLLCVPFGQKIQLSSCQFMLGGNATNVAVGLRRAGYRTALVAELAHDEFAEKIVNGLKKEGVSLDHIVYGEGQSSFSIGLNVNNERTLFIEHQERKHNFHLDTIDTDMIYLTSLGHTWEHVYAHVAKYLQLHHTTELIFNPGSLQIQTGLASFAYLLPLTTVLFVNKEEAEKLLRRKGEVNELLESLKSKGPRMVVITDGEKGSYCIDERGSIYHRDSLRVPVVERTGAGDAYATGFTAAYLDHQTIKTCMLWGTHNAASVIGQAGAQTGLLRKEELIIKQ